LPRGCDCPTVADVIFRPPPSLTPAELLRECRRRQGEGAAFEAIWADLLAAHPLTLGAMTTAASGGGRFQRIPLKAGGALVFDGDLHEWSLSGG